MKPSYKNFYYLLFFSLAGLILYHNVIIYGSFVFDDNLLIENNSYIRSIKNFFKFFTTSSEAGASLTSNFYRPTQQILNSLIYAITGLKPFLYHLVSVLIHSTNSFLVYLLLIALNFSVLGSLLGALFFLVHPVQVEAVAYISGVADPLGMLFMLTGILFFIKIINNKHINDRMHTLKTLAFLSFTLALLSKENTLMFSGLILIIAIYFNKLKNKKNIIIISSCFILSLIYLFLKLKVFNFTQEFGLTGASNIYTNNMHIRIITFINILWEYFKLLIFPKHLYLERPYIGFVTLTSLQALFGVLVLASAIIFSIKSFKKNKIVFLGICWFFISIVPVTGIIPLNAIYLEHWLYFPIIGLSILLAYFFSKKRSIVYLIIFSCFVILLSIRTMKRNIEWSDAIKFYKNELFYNSKTARIHNNLAMEYDDRNNFKLAIYHFNRAAEIRDVYPQTHHNLANLYSKLGKFDIALDECFKALAIDPQFLYSYGLMHRIFKQTNDKIRLNMCVEFINKIKSGGRVSREEFEKLRIG